MRVPGTGRVVSVGVGAGDADPEEGGSVSDPVGGGLTVEPDEGGPDIAPPVAPPQVAVEVARRSTAAASMPRRHGLPVLGMWSTSAAIFVAYWRLQSLGELPNTLAFGSGSQTMPERVPYL